MESSRQIDHIVYAVPNLDEAINQVEQATGISPTFGGYHPLQGTKNALLNIGNGCYLELLSIDRDNNNVQPLRWMGVDLIQRAKITRWALKSNDLIGDQTMIKALSFNCGTITGGQRKTAEGDLLKWELIMPASTPEVEVIPFMVDWSQSSHHPTDRLDKQAEIVNFRIFHPEPEKIRKLFIQLSVDLQIIKSNQIRMELKIKGPAGSFLIN